MIRGRRWWLGSVSLVGLCAGVLVAVALAAPGDVTFVGCVSGDTAAGAGAGAGKNCVNVPNSAAFGTASGLDGLVAVALSPDGKQLYAASEFDDAVVVLDRNPNSGALSFDGCVSGDTAAGTGAAGKNCANVPNSAAGGTASGLNNLSSVALSPDGKQLYAASPSDDAVVVLDRNPNSGALTFDSCVSGDTAAGTGAADKNCANVPNSAAAGAASGLNNLVSVALSPDGNQLYAASISDDAVVVLDRNPNSGALTFGGCVSGNTAAGTGADKNCVNVPNSAAGGTASGLNGLRSVALSPDGKQLYAASLSDDAVVVFDRDPNSGALSFGGCVSGDTAAGAAADKNCANVPNSAAAGAASGLDSLVSVALSPDGKQLYAASINDDAVVVLDREPFPAAPPAETTPRVVDTTPPVLSALSLSRKRFRVGAERTPLTAQRKRAPAGTRVRYRLSEDATVRLVVERRLAGRRTRVRGRTRCVKPTRRLARQKAKRCSRYRRRGTLSRAGKAGPNSFAFSGRIASRKLAPGNYRLRANASDAAGNSSNTRTVTFTITRR